jgi:hypothetical protein
MSHFLLVCLAAFQIVSPQQPSLHIRVGVPCRITIVDAKGNLAEIEVAKAPHLAIRQGVVYTATGSADVSLKPGEYTVYATRGPMFSLAQRKISVRTEDQNVSLTLTREVELPGYVSCDPHIHTLTFSGHGDCTAEERMVTLAGEQVDLPISTEHNRHIDYGPIAKSTGTSPYFTPVIGNEVTTPNGHFNIFPVPAAAKPPMYDSKDRAAVLSGIRSVPRVRLAIFNHTNDTHSGVRPGHPERFHALSGESLDGSSWDVDAMEVINSSAQQSDPMRLFRTWFALLNSGKPVVGIGSSDSHDVNLYIVGQARTYIPSSAASPNKIDPEEAFRNLKAGKALISSGLVTQMWVDGAGVGETRTGGGDELKVRVKVQGPRWLNCDRVDVFANGGVITAIPVSHSFTAISKLDLTFTMPRPKQDMWLVAIASGPGPGDKALYWPLSRPYQPTLAHWDPRVIGATNPIRIDGDRDDKYSSPREYAVKLVDAAAGDLKKLFQTLEEYDPAIIIQAAALLRQRGTDLSSGPVRQALDSAGPAVVQAFKAYQIVLKRDKD